MGKKLDVGHLQLDSTFLDRNKIRDFLGKTKRSGQGEVEVGPQVGDAEVQLTPAVSHAKGFSEEDVSRMLHHSLVKYARRTDAFATKTVKAILKEFEVRHTL